jgi:uncharacterized iron-regulated membrane protein
MTVERIAEAARNQHPGYEVSEVSPGESPNHAIQVRLTRRNETTLRLFHPSTGDDLGHALPAGFRFTQWLLDFHDNLLNGPTGRQVNGIGAVLLLVLCLSGAVIWWPGLKTWRQSLVIQHRANWPRFAWTVHSALGFWTWGFLLLWAVTGTYLAFSTAFGSFFDYIQPLDETNPTERLVDQIQYWLAYLHFGRLGGRGIPGCGRGLCNTTTKVIWAVVGLAPTIMFITAVMMWWHRSGRRRLRRSRL